MIQGEWKMLLYLALHNFLTIVASDDPYTCSLPCPGLGHPNFRHCVLPNTGGANPQQVCDSIDWCKDVKRSTQWSTLRGLPPTTGHPTFGGGKRCRKILAGEQYRSVDKLTNEFLGAYDFESVIYSDDVAPELSDEVLWVNHYDIFGLRFATANTEAFGQLDRKDAIRQYTLDDIKYRSVGHWIFPGSVAVDIGANIGDTTIPIAFFASKTIAFEPIPSAYSTCLSQINVNQHMNIDLHPFALTDRDGPVKFQATNVNGGIDGAWAAGSSSPTFNVEGRDVVNFFRTTYPDDYKKIGFIKIDAEGYDMELLKLMKPLLDEMSPKPIIKVEWFHPFSKGGGAGCSSLSSKLFDSFAFIGYQPRNERTNEVLTTCASSAWIPDIVLIPLSDPIMTQPLDFDTVGLENGLKLQSERELPFWIALNSLREPAEVTTTNVAFENNNAPVAVAPVAVAPVAVAPVAVAPVAISAPMESAGVVTPVETTAGNANNLRARQGYHGGQKTKRESKISRNIRMFKESDIKFRILIFGSVVGLLWVFLAKKKDDKGE